MSLPIWTLLLVASVLTSGTSSDLAVVVDHEVEHVQQRYSWDCGISCVLMVLPEYKRKHLVESLAVICQDEGFHNSTWTIDLCYLLKRYNMKFVFYTITLGIHPSYQNNSFYSKVLEKDEARVVRKFKDAKTNGITVENSSVRLDQILHHLSEGGPVIVLTDAYALDCTSCKGTVRNHRVVQLRRWKRRYQGHYILLCGFCMQSQVVFYRNPALSNRVCNMSFDTLEDARKSYGTDEDTIFVFQQ